MLGQEISLLLRHEQNEDYGRGNTVKEARIDSAAGALYFSTGHFYMCSNGIFCFFLEDISAQAVLHVLKRPVLKSV